MKLTFESTWTDLRYRLRPGASIEYWSVGRGYSGKSFRAEDLDGAAVVVLADGIAKERRIAKSEFEKVFRLWPKYASGETTRSDLGKMTGSQNTSYIISLFNWTNITSSSRGA